MKQRLLSFVAIAALSCAAMAQSWTAPVKPDEPSCIASEEYVADGTTAYFVYNVGCSQFLTAAGYWATQMKLSDDGQAYLQVLLEPLSETDEETFPGCVKIKLNGTFTFKGDHKDRVNGYNVSNTYLFRDSEASGFIDRNGQAVWYWRFGQNSAGNYYWQSAPGQGDNKFPNSSEQYASGGKGQFVVFNTTIEDKNIEWRLIPVSSFDQAKMDIYTAELELYDARVALYNTLNEAVTYSVDYADASAVYNKSDATAEEITAAYEVLRPAVNHAILLAAIASSSEDSPYDVTQYVLKNPTFDEGMTGWTITEGMGQNLQVQAHHYPENNPEAESFIENFIEAWRDTPNGPLSNGVICQTVTGLPEGRYRIEADVMAVWQGAALSEEPKGIYLFYNNGKFTLHGESLATENGVPEHFSFDFDYDGAETMTIGLMAENTNQNWMGFDNLKLYAIGEVQTPPSFYALMTEVEASEEYDTDDIYAEASLKTAFQAAYAPAVTLAGDQNPTKEKADKYTNAYETLHEARLALEASIKDYEKLQKFINQIQDDYNAYKDQSMFANLCTQLNNKIEEYQGGYENGSYTIGEIDGFIAAYANVIKDYIQDLFDSAAKDAESGITLDDPINITSLFEHMSYEYTELGNNDRPSLTAGYPKDAPIWKNETGVGGFKTNYSTAEVWNDRPFKISRTFENLPNGRYEIRVHGFYRMAANDVNYPAYNNGEYIDQEGAFLFAGSNKSAFTNVAEVAHENNIDGDTNVGSEEEPIYVSNSQKGAHMLFSDAAYAELAAKCYIATATNVKNGTLTVGVMGNENLQANHWTVWQDFELYYYGAADANALDEEIEALINVAEPIYTDGGEGDAVILVDAILTGLKDAIKQGGDAIGTDADTQKAAIKALEDAIALARENMSVFTELETLVTERATAIQNLVEYTFDDPGGYLALLTEYDDHIAAESFDSHEQMQTLLTRLKDEWFDYLFSVQGIDEASETAPVDMSFLIANATFDNNNKDGWTVEQVGNAGGDGNGCAEFWGATSFDISQEFPYLKDGYWRLSVDALYRFGGTASEINAIKDNTVRSVEMLYANDLSKPIMLWSDTKGGAFTPETVPTIEDKKTDEETGEETTTTVPKYTEYVVNDDVKFYTVNDKAGFEKMIADGRYHNEIVFAYGEGYDQALSDAVKFGLKKAEKPSSDNDWCPFDNFRLEYLGLEKPTAVESLGAKTPASATINAIYSIDGRQQSQLRRGINIVRTADGKITKVLVK